MDPLTIGLIGTGGLVVLIVLGMPIAFGGVLIGFLGLVVLSGWGTALEVVGYLPHPLATKYSLSVIPMFIIMGYFAYYAGLTRDAFSAANAWVGRLPGGLGIASVVSCALFAAATGSSTASAAVMGKVAVPEMRRHNYERGLAAGVVAASGTLASLIPPSTILVIYAILVEQSVGKLLLAGFIPGVLSGAIYAIMLMIRGRLTPNLAPVGPPTSWKQKFRSLRGVWGIILLFLIVIGGIYIGVFTPTEAGALGAFGAFVIALASRRLNWSNFKDSLLETARSTVMIFMIIVGVLIFMRFLAMSGVTREFIEFAQGLPVPSWVVLSSFLALFVILGMFMDAIGMLTLTLPLIYPVVTGLGYDPIWFGVIAVKMCEICLITPPIGLNVYMVRGVTPDIPLEDIFRGCFYFLAMDILTLAILVAFPQISTFLPSTMEFF